MFWVYLCVLELAVIALGIDAYQGDGRSNWLIMGGFVVVGLVAIVLGMLGVRDEGPRGPAARGLGVTFLAALALWWWAR
jgi:hypothetical protein